ncbi:putative F-box protein-like [Capsicum annuum]|nr:putative FBD-associated F-box protein At5g56690 [Capsicum annuum]KAF3665632.1 putative F-box protein-like [Capsicum annuum]
MAERGVKTVDILPECLIQEILGFLRYDEATKTSILSKTWLQAWSTLPNLKFTSDFYEVNMDLVDNIMERYRDENIPIEKFELSKSYYSCPSRIVPLFYRWLDVALQNGVKYLVFRIRNLPLPIFTILAAKSLKELVLTNCDLTCASLSSGVVNCPSLRKLSLIKVYLDEDMLQTLLNSCPLIESFTLKDCMDLIKIELLNLQKIKSVSIWNNINQHIKIQAPTLEHLSYSGYPLEELNIVECQNLKSLELSHMYIYDPSFYNLISRCQSLKVLKFQHCWCTGRIEAPNLVSLEYMGDQIPELKIARESSQLEHSKIILLRCYDNIDAAWFCKLRKFLSNLTSWSQVSLYFYQCGEINVKDLQLDHRVDIPQVGVLNVDFKREIKKCSTFIDALLWSCHPRRLNLKLTGKMATFFINYLMHMKNSSHSTSHGKKPWYSQLKEVKAYKLDRKSRSWHLVEHKSEELATRKRDKYYILLDW